ncbi:amino acid ABC transporter permease [Microvirga splendida]|uniref:Amino acid ABC transporter permease n=1 Tax=Microvirga splendida TaxID=2795727 RepID=A0ABS0Y4G3_9HYPH|nr:amino acid ABC transporter permease [Microvirga splendida]MBJ6126930.1 amino acid ABC transporter permease [Microvirga splendida]
MTTASNLPLEPIADAGDNAVLALRPPARRKAPIAQVLFGTIGNTLLTLATAAILLAAVPRLIQWGILDSIWTATDGSACREASGACWAFLRAKFRQILFGIYPPDQQWRPLLAVTMLFCVILYSLPPRNWDRFLVFLWCIAVACFLVLMQGGVLGLTLVPTAYWGGLPVTLILAVSALGIGFPFGVILALGRRSALPVPRILSVGLIEVIRGLPLVSLLFMSSIMLPIMLPEGLTIDKLARAGVALTIFSAAYLAEVVRGGLQAIPEGQAEAARALGLSWVDTIRQVILPQALQKVIPPLTNTVIVMVKNTALVLVVGLFDLLSSGKAALADPSWPSPFAETYLFIAMIYFVICFGISRYSLYLERRAAAGQVR